MATATNTPILKLEALDEYPTVEISGVRYALMPPDALPLAKIKRFQRLAPRLAELWEIEATTPEQDTEISAILRALAEIALDAPVDVLDRLVDAQHWMIYRAFLGLSTNVLENAGSTPHLQTTVPPAPPSPRPNPTGAKRSRDSRGSTAGTPTGGSPRSRSRSPARR